MDQIFPCARGIRRCVLGAAELDGRRGRRPTRQRMLFLCHRCGIGAYILFRKVVCLGHGTIPETYMTMAVWASLLVGSDASFHPCSIGFLNDRSNLRRRHLRSNTSTPRSILPLSFLLFCKEPFCSLHGESSTLFLPLVSSLTLFESAIPHKIRDDVRDPLFEPPFQATCIEQLKK